MLMYFNPAIIDLPTIDPRVLKTSYSHQEVKEAAKEEVKEEPKEEVIELKVPICCEGCVEKMEKKLILMEGMLKVLDIV